MITGTRATSHVRPRQRRGRLTAAVAGAALALGAAAPVPTAAAAAPGGISGTVTSETGAPLTGITVRVYDLDPFVGDVLMGEDETDENGDYLIDGLRPDPYYKVQFSDPDGAWATEYYDDAIVSPPSAEWVAVTDGAVTSDVDAELGPGSTLSGRLTRAGGGPVAGGTITLWWRPSPQSGARVSDHVADADGRWTIRGVRGGLAYGLEFRDPQTGATEAWNDRPDILSGTPLEVPVGGAVPHLDALLGGVVTNVSAPTISGTPKVGQTLTASSGWQPVDATVAYRWIVGDDVSPGDDPRGATYVPSAADVGKTIRVEATATRGAGWIPATAFSAPVGPVAAAPVLAIVNERLPRIKGTLRVGRTVRVTTGDWTPYPKNLRFRWYAGGKKVAGATHRRLKLTTKQAGKRLVVRVTATAPGHEPLTVRTRRSDRVRR